MSHEASHFYAICDVLGSDLFSITNQMREIYAGVSIRHSKRCHFKSMCLILHGMEFIQNMLAVRSVDVFCIALHSQ